MPASEQRPTVSLRIHGDNIIECERALFLIADSFAAHVHPIISAPYIPQYEIRCNSELSFCHFCFGETAAVFREKFTSHQHRQQACSPSKM